MKTPFGFLSTLRRCVSPLHVISLSLLIHGCAWSNRDTVNTIYVLDPSITQSTSTPTGNQVLQVTPTMARPGYDGAAIAYTQEPLRLDYYAYSRWADQPAKMIETAVIRSLEASGQFRAVINASSSARANLRLDTELVSLRHELLSKPSVGHIILRAQLTDINAAKVIATRTFDETVPAEAEAPQAGVAAMNSALGKLLTELAAFSKTGGAGP